MYFIKTILLACSLCALSFALRAQQVYVVGMEIMGNDTLPAITIDDTVGIYASRLANKDEAREYENLKRRIIKMYPYSEKAVALLRQVEDSIALMDKKRDQKRYINGVLEQLNTLFFQDMKDKFTKKEGFVMMKMVERKTNEPLYKTISRMKNPTYAFVMQTVAKQYDYDLKRGYDPEHISFDRDMEEILQFLEKNGGVKSLDRNATAPPTGSFATFDSLPSTEKYRKQRKK